MIQAAELAEVFKVKPQQINNLRTRYELSDDDSFVKSNGRRFYTPQGVRKILEKRGYFFQRRNVSICNLKGGVGKTTIAVQLARKTAEWGFKTLLVDCDKQGNASDQLWVKARDTDFPCLYDIIKNHVKVESAFVKINDFLTLLPSNLKNQLLEDEIKSANINKGTFFRRLLGSFDFDVIVFDTEPNLSQVNLMALAYCDTNIAPVRLDKYSMDGLVLLLGFIEKQKKEWPEMMVQTKVLINAYDKRMRTESIRKIHEVSELNLNAFNSTIRTDPTFARTQYQGEIGPKTKAYEDITLFTAELLRLDKAEQAQS